MEANRTRESIAAFLDDPHKRWRNTEIPNDCDALVAKTKKPHPVAIVLRTGSPAEAAERLRDRFRLSELERKVSDLMREVSELKASRLSPATVIRGSSSDPQLLQVVQITNEMFPGEVTLEVSYDPSEPDEKVVVFQVTSRESAKDIVQQRKAWHRRIGQIPPTSSGRFSLSVIPLE